MGIQNRKSKKSTKTHCININNIMLLHNVSFYVDTLYWVQRKSSGQGRTRFAEDDMIYNRDLLKCWSFLATSMLGLIY